MATGPLMFYLFSSKGIPIVTSDARLGDTSPENFQSAATQPRAYRNRFRLRKPGAATSWTLPVPDGAYSRVVVWNGSQHWIDALTTAFNSPEGKAARSHISMTLDTMLAVARQDAAAADSTTGRSVATSHATVAARLGCSDKTVQRARDVIQALGFAVSLVTGRRLFGSERVLARNTHGRTQINAASVRALTLPRGATAVENVHLPSKQNSSSKTCVKRKSPKRAQVRSAASRRKADYINPSAKIAPSRDPRTVKCANELAQRLPFLGNWRSRVVEVPGVTPRIEPAPEPISVICGVIARSGIDVARLTSADVIDVLDRITADSGLVTMRGNYVKNPVGYLTTLLRRVRSYIDLNPFKTAAERHQAAEERRRQLREAQTIANEKLDAQLAQRNAPETIAAREEFFASFRAKTAAAAI